MNLEQKHDIEPQIFTKDELAFFHSEFNTLFSDIYEHRVNNLFPYLRSLAIFQEKLQELIGHATVKQEQDRKTQTQVLKIFFEELISFTEAKRREENKDKEFNYFLNEIYEIFFSYSPNVFSLLPDIEKIKIGSSLTRDSHLMAGIGQTPVSETIYYLNFGDNQTTEEILNEFKKSSTLEQIELLDYLETIVLSSQRHYSWATNIYSKVKNILDKLKTEKVLPLLRYKIEALISIISKPDSQNQSPLISRNNSEEIRASKEKRDKQIKENEYYQQRINPKSKTKAQTIAKISNDALGVFNHGNKLTEISLSDFQEIHNTSPKIREDLLKTIKTNIENSRFKRLEVKVEALYFLIEKIFKEHMNPDEFEEKMGPIYKIFSKQELEAFLTSYGNLYQFNEELEKKKRKLKEAFQNERVEMFIQLALENIINLQKVSPFIQDEELINLNSPYSDEERIRRFQKIETIYKLAQIHHQTHSAISKNIEGYETLDFNDKLFEQFEKNQGHFEKLEEQYKSQFENQSKQKYQDKEQDENTINKCLTKIETLFANKKDYLLETLKEVESQNNSSKPRIIFEEISMILNNPDVLIKGNTLDPDTALLLMHIHSPELKDKIEEDLGIDLSKISLRSQIRLLQFLTEADIKVFEEFRNALKSISSEDKNRILESFLICGEDKESGFSILKLAKYENSKEIFLKINELLQLIDEQTVRFNLETNRNTGIKIDKSLYNRTIVKRVLQLVRTLSTKEPINNKDTLSKLEVFEKSVTDWGALFKASNIGSFPDTTNMEAFKNIEISLIQGGNLIQPGNEETKRISFPDRESFGEKEFEFLQRNIKDSYDTTNPELSKIALSETWKSLNDPESQLIVIRNSQNAEIVGMCKITQGQNGFKFGSHYVDSRYQGNFGIGDSLQKIALSLIPEGNEITAEVILSNPSIIRHIEIFEGIGTNLRNLKTKGGILMEFKWNYKKKYKTKDKKTYTREKIISLTKTNKKDKDIQAFIFDTRPEKEKDFLEKAETLFKEGFVLTRIFYEDEESELKRIKTIMVFEKI